MTHLDLTEDKTTALVALSRTWNTPPVRSDPPTPVNDSATVFCHEDRMTDEHEAMDVVGSRAKMAKADLTAEQRDHLERHVAGIGHNQGPALLEHTEEIIEPARHHRLKAELTGIRVMLDMLRSEITGEYELPATTTRYVTAGVVLVAAITGVGIATQPFSALLLDAPVVACIIAALRGEIEEYVDWRGARDPSYLTIKQELYGARDG